MFNSCNLESQPELYDETKKSVPDNFKTETPKSLTIDEFLSIRAEAFACTCDNREESKTKIKEITKKALKKKRKIQLLGAKTTDQEKNPQNNCIRKNNHELYVRSTNKYGLLNFMIKKNL